MTRARVLTPQETEDGTLLVGAGETFAVLAQDAMTVTLDLHGCRGVYYRSDVELLPTRAS